MRGRLRYIFDDDELLNLEKSRREDGSTVGVVIDYGLPDGKEFPTYDGNFLSFVVFLFLCMTLHVYDL